MSFEKISLKGRALRYLSMREHSRAELERKLAPHEEVPGELAQALDELQARGFIDEQRVIESLLYRRASRLGAGRLRQELQAKGVQGEAVQQALAGLKDSELSRAQAVWAKRFDQLPTDAPTRAKQSRFLLTRGFSSEVVRRVLAGQGAPDEGLDSSAD
ncbi:recombination regulator RecX [Curvibacter sp. RS43]|uniref:recombination regulator RecX n=1 Tax=Curvibacter microcysteis TaxID=3026419 RepID=UPI002361D596|nr:recombination regulator RecX [Curvibacter sp. RS43]MDD0810940.1 recombination regulator RecX [Curvibacter sp. RS43]